eukprot:Skav209730  [mRNA]  locus=scaffold528:549072:557286:- [translate_table: standard]
MVDRPSYADEAHTPKIALRQIFGRLGLRTELCRAAADSGLLNVEVFASLGDTAAASKTALRTLIAEATLGANNAEIELALMQLAAVWHSCHALQGQFATRRARMEEDPNKEELQTENGELKEKLREKVWTMALATASWLRSSLAALGIAALERAVFGQSASSEDLDRIASMEIEYQQLQQDAGL